LAHLCAITVPIMPIYRRDEVGHMLDDAQVTAVVTAGAFRGFDYLAMYRGLAADRTALHTVVVVRDDDGVAAAADPLVVGLDTVTAAEAALGPPVGPDEPFVIVYTSGTPARPKGCVHTFNTYLGGTRVLGPAFGYTESDVQFGPSPVTHTTGLVTSVRLPLLYGAATHFMPEWEPGRGLAEIASTAAP
jgi:acyl-coenzyme A synthetase/AMP-(fatty) acid ligase